MITRPNWEILEAGLTEIIDKDDAVAAQQYSESVTVTFDEISSGEILSMALYSSELGSGSVLETAGRMYIFDADPAISAGDAALATAGAEHKTLLGVVHFESTDWDSDTSGGIGFKACAIPFHHLTAVYCAFRPDSGSTTINSAAGDDEELHFNFWYRKDS